MSDFRYTVTPEEEGSALKTIVKTHFSFSSRLMTKLKQQNLIFVNNEPLPGWISVSAGDEVLIRLPEERSNFPAENIPLRIVYEDSDILVINKQPGIVVHPTKGKPVHTVANALMFHMLKEAGCDMNEVIKMCGPDANSGEDAFPDHSDQMNDPDFDVHIRGMHNVDFDKLHVPDESKLYKIRFVNRLDMNTSGLLIVAKNSHSQDSLEKQMSGDHINKRYMALLDGSFSLSINHFGKADSKTYDDGISSRSYENGLGTVNAPLGRPDPDEVERWIVPADKGGFPSVTHYKVLGEYKGEAGYYSLVELKLETGRTHQIRIHMASTGHPVVGDHLYCNGDPFEYRRIHGDHRPPKDGTPGPREYNPEVVSELIPRQALHAFSLDFTHPVTGEPMHLEAPLPDDIKSAIESLTPIL